MCAVKQVIAKLRRSKTGKCFCKPGLLLRLVMWLPHLLISTFFTFIQINQCYPRFKTSHYSSQHISHLQTTHQSLRLSLRLTPFHWESLFYWKRTCKHKKGTDLRPLHTNCKTSCSVLVCLPNVCYVVLSICYIYPEIFEKKGMSFLFWLCLNFLVRITDLWAFFWKWCFPLTLTYYRTNNFKGMSAIKRPVANMD